MPTNAEGRQISGQKLDARARAIITELCRVGPANLSAAARRVGIPVETLRYRYKSLIARGTFKLSIFASYSKMGLSRASLFIETNKTRSKTLAEALEGLNFWTYLAPCWGAFEGFYGVYTIPKQMEGHFRGYLERLAKGGLAQRYTLLWTDDPIAISPDFDWYDEESGAWHFQWNEWKALFSERVRAHARQLRRASTDNITIDETDLAIAGLMEQRPLVNFSELGRELKMTGQAIRYHYTNHLERQGIISGYAPTMLPYPLGDSDMLALAAKFRNWTGVAKFACAAAGTPFIRNFAVARDNPTVLAHVYLPRSETRAFVSKLYDLAFTRILQDFYYATLDLGHYKAWTVRYENFSNGEWHYPQVEYDRRLDLLIKERKKEKQP